MDKRWRTKYRWSIRVVLALVLAAGLAALGLQAWKRRLAADERAFRERTEPQPIAHGFGMYYPMVEFIRPPDAASLRHLERLPGRWEVDFEWRDGAELSDPSVLRGRRLSNVDTLMIKSSVDADPWLKEIARPDSALKALKGLDVGRATDVGLKELGTPNCGLRALTTLDIGGEITDGGVQALAAPDTGLTSLASLRIAFTDAEVQVLAAPGGGLKSLTELDLTYTSVGDAGVRALSQPDSGPKSLRTLNLSHTKITPAAIKEMTRPDSGLRGLVSLGLSENSLSQDGLAELSRPDSGLKSLAVLNLDGLLGNSGCARFNRPDSGLKGLVRLSVKFSYFSNAGVREFARPDSGLKSLTLLDITGTTGDDDIGRVTDAGLDELRRARPGLTLKTTDPPVVKPAPPDNTSGEVKW